MGFVLVRAKWAVGASHAPGPETRVTAFEGVGVLRGRRWP